ncbi:MAG: D-tyrosyl-tRNA(Tyr) deacylase [Bacteroidales bacterium]|nr:D-tyrosyl-tRNA(Tyr) deacylase [Bacteroidales bacterium]
MRVVIQRVSNCTVTINENLHSTIGKGLFILLGIEAADNLEDLEWLCGKISRLRVFNDSAGVMNLSVAEVEGSIMVVSQFTLHASTKKGNRPSYIRSASPDIAVPLYESFLSRLEELSGRPVASGKFGAHMDISLVNEGPVTILIDSKNRE